MIVSPRSSAVPGQPPQTAPLPQARLFLSRAAGPGGCSLMPWLSLCEEGASPCSRDWLCMEGVLQHSEPILGCMPSQLPSRVSIPHWGLGWGSCCSRCGRSFVSLITQTTQTGRAVFACNSRARGRRRAAQGHMLSSADGACCVLTFRGGGLGSACGGGTTAQGQLAAPSALVLPLFDHS